MKALQGDKLLNAAGDPQLRYQEESEVQRECQRKRRNTLKELLFALFRFLFFSFGDKENLEKMGMRNR